MGGTRSQERMIIVTAGVALAGTLGGGVLWLNGEVSAAHVAWAATTALLLVPLTWSVIRTLLRGDVGVDAIALLSMAGALAVGEYFAGAVVAVMLAGGNALEAFAQNRAGRELSTLVSKIPTTANVRRDDEIVIVGVDEVEVGDRMVIKAGDTVPADGSLVSPDAVMDTASLTGEPLPAHLIAGDDVPSGFVNAGAAVEITTTRPAVESTYAALVRLVRAAQGSQAPFVRMADRYAVWFLAFTLALAGLAWAASADPVRAVAVLVVATPCPLILAAPVALVSGVSRAARSGVIVKGAAVIEQLGAVRTVMFDKTGTLTGGTPVVMEIDGAGSDDTNLLRLAASLDQASAHVVAQALVCEARERGLQLDFPTELDEVPGQGISGRVNGVAVAVGSYSFLSARGISSLPPHATIPGSAVVLVAINGAYAGHISVSDRLRSDARRLVQRLREEGVEKVLLVTGDQRPVANAIAAASGIDDVFSEMTAEGKLGLVKSFRDDPKRRSVVMVGDGVNDAPALALADVGIAIGRTATAASETADAVIVVDRIERVADAIAIGRRSMRIARQSVVVGLALSSVAMLFAAAGLLPPVAGALLQEVIDFAVIANALRALRE
jgi:heavy metal translocating P-type ATPase